MRVTFTDARRGSKVADLCDDCAGKVAGPRCGPPRAPAEGRGRLTRSAAANRRSERRSDQPPDARVLSVASQIYDGP